MRQIYRIFIAFLCLLGICRWTAAQEIREDRLYRLVSPSGLAIDNRMNPDNLGNLYLEPVDRKDKGQLWRLVSYGDAYVVYSPFTNKSFDIVNAGGNDTPLGTWDFSRANVNQHFIVKPEGADIVRRLGLGIVMKGSYDNVEWYGRGPHENYVDRCRSALVGIYKATADDFASEHYVRSQSMGNREEVRWFEVTGKAGNGLKVEVLDGTMSFSVMHYTDGDLWNAGHDFRLPEIRRNETYVNMDVIQQGLGNATCGPLPLEKYVIPEGQPLRYSFRMSKIR